MIIRSKAPLRLGFAGGGTDISSYSDKFGGCVLNATINLHAYCTIIPTNTSKILFKATDLNHKEEYKKQPILTTQNKLRLHTAVYNKIISKFNNNQPLSFEMYTYSDAPAGSGLGASSTLVVAIITAFVEWLNLPLSNYEISALAYEIERVDLKLAGGKQDQYAATFGGFNFMEFCKDGKVVVIPLNLKPWILNELESSTLLFYTGISRESANIIQNQIECTQNSKSQKLQHIHEIKQNAFIMKDSLLKGDFNTFNDTIINGWIAKKNSATAISNEYIDDLYNFILTNGGSSAKISGAGGGGFMMIHCDPIKRMHLSKKLADKNGTILIPSFSSKGSEAWTIY